uniref:Gibberellin n b20-oxidase n=1 Tax=Solanum tuberosum TaxID=4113 RepID=M1E082_SOLTU
MGMVRSCGFLEHSTIAKPKSSNRSQKLHATTWHPGLQVFVDNEWYSIRPNFNAFVVKIDDTFMNPKKQPPPQDIIEETCDNNRIKEKKAKVPNSIGKDFCRSSVGEGTDGKGRGKKRERVGQDIDLTLSQHSADAEDSSR